MFDRLFNWVALALLAIFALWGVLNIVNGVAYVSGIGPQTTVYIERSRVDEIPSGTEGDVIRVRVHEGYYLDDAGQRHPTEVTGGDFEPGDVVHTRRPILPKDLAFTLHGNGQAIGIIALGLVALGLSAVLIYFLWQAIDESW